MIVADNISKSYKDVQALSNVSFRVEEGELFGLIGPDGAGKSSLFRVLTTLLLPDEGKGEVAGFDIVKDFKSIRKHVGYMPGRFSLYQDLTVEENLNFFATIFGTTVQENYDLVKDIYKMLEPFKNRRAGDLSGGMKQKLALSCAMIHRPKVLFLDEPTTGVDPVSRKEFWEMLQNVKQQGISILVSTAYMDEASLCDRVALIQNGKILTVDPPQKIVEDFNHQIWKVKTDNKFKLLKDLENFSSRYNSYAFGEYMHYIDENSEFNGNDLKSFLESENHQNIQIEPSQTTIEDVFIEMSKEQ